MALEFFKVNFPQNLLAYLFLGDSKSKKTECVIWVRSVHLVSFNYFQFFFKLCFYRRYQLPPLYPPSANAFITFLQLLRILFTKSIVPFLACTDAP